MDPDATWYGGRPRPRPHCARWRPSSPRLPPKKGGTAPNFRPMSIVVKTVGWIKMPFGMELGLGPGYIVLDSFTPQQPPILDPCLFWSNGWMDQAATWYEGRPRSRAHSVIWGPATSPPTTKRGLPNFRPMSIVAKRSPISATAEHMLHLGLYAK